ncbi:MAG: M48 family metalloprotease [Myxococcota bacterium]
MTIARSWLLLSLTGCGLNLFSVQDDIDLGMQLRDQINSDPKNFPVVDRMDAPEAYDELERMLGIVLESEDIQFRDEFAWEIYLIDDDETLNAFAGPGGYIWIYTGIMEYLTVEDHFVGVLGHEAAHADRRHSTDQLTQNLGIDLLLDVVLGDDRGALAQVTEGLLSLRFSRADEADADDFSVRYLCNSAYAADGAAGFFRQIQEDGGVGVPEFLSSHPSPDNRVEDITATAGELNCPTEKKTSADWDRVLATLP